MLTVDRYVRYVTVTIYKAVSGIWLITLKNMFLDKISDNKYSKTINFEGGSYRVLVRLDYSSRAEPVTLTVFYVKNPEGFNPMRYISVALISAGALIFYKYCEKTETYEYLISFAINL